MEMKQTVVSRCRKHSYTKYYSCVPGDLAFDWKGDWSRLCCDTDLTTFEMKMMCFCQLVYTTLVAEEHHFHIKGSEVCITT